MSGDHRNKKSRDLGYDIINARYTFGAGALLGFVLATLLVLALSRWLPEDWTAPIMITGFLGGGVLASLLLPVERFDRNPDHYPDAVTPAERVDRLHGKTKDSSHDQ